MNGIDIKGDDVDLAQTGGWWRAHSRAGLQR